ncbi:MAG TPA: hypothetical protein PLX33_05960 [Alphaproteobacteria bacterium]|nr:hypothetical protein [Alphaproteobacteria bacterium]
MAETAQQEQKATETTGAEVETKGTQVDTAGAPDDIRDDETFEGLTSADAGPASTTPESTPENNAAPVTPPPEQADAAPQNDSAAEETPAPPRAKAPAAATPEDEEEGADGAKKKKSKFLNDEYQQMIYRKIWKVDEIDPEVAKVIDNLKYDNKKGVMTFETPAGDVKWGVDSHGREFIGRRGLFSGMTQDLANAEMTLAAARGWKGVSVHGRESTKEMLWLAAQRQGLNVSNFVPKETSEVYKIWKKESEELSGVMNAETPKAPKDEAKPAENKADAPEAAAPAAEEPAAPATAEATAEEPAAPATAEATAEEPAAPATAEATAEEPAAPATAEATAEEPAAPATAEATAEEPAAPATAEATAEEPAAPATAEATAEEPAAPATAEASPEEPAAPVVSKFGAVETPPPATDDPWENPPQDEPAAAIEKPAGHDDPYSKESLAARGMVNPLPAGDAKYEAWEKKKEGINRADYSGWEQDYRDAASVERLSQSAAEAKSPAHAEGITKLQDALKSGKIAISDSFDRLAISKVDTPAGYQQAADYFQKKAGGADLGLPKVEAPAETQTSSQRPRNKGNAPS